MSCVSASINSILLLFSYLIDDSEDILEPSATTTDNLDEEETYMMEKGVNYFITQTILMSANKVQYQMLFQLDCAFKNRERTKYEKSNNIELIDALTHVISLHRSQYRSNRSESENDNSSSDDGAETRRKIENFDLDDMLSVSSFRDNVWIFESVRDNRHIPTNTDREDNEIIKVTLKIKKYVFHHTRTKHGKYSILRTSYGLKWAEWDIITCTIVFTGQQCKFQFGGVIDPPGIFLEMQGTSFTKKFVTVVTQQTQVF
ncbi:hypothetical protein EDC94DRAFT_653627 [Helicostylum pulchrum]|nr:hypothetical protein EDC94DRAFT_653627 [Helicostylum pulchrum]